MENTLQDIEQLRNGFQACQKILTALGDENRQRLLCIMLGGDCGGSRVVDIAEKTNLSRPAVSHHMQILKDAGIVKVRKEGTYVYYYLDPDETEIEKMIALFSNIRRIMRNVPDRSGEDTIFQEVRSMDVMKVMKERHSVRSYEDKAIDKEVKKELLSLIAQCNKESGLHMQLVTDEPQAFDGFLAHYGKFSGVKNYIAMVGKKGADLEELCGYYGENVVLKAQELGLNTCWVALTYSKIRNAFKLAPGEKLCCVIAIGYGATQGVSHKVKAIEDLCKTKGDMPRWFRNGMEAAQLAPTAMNQQKFLFTLRGNRVSAQAGRGFYTKLDLGIAKYHFEAGAGTSGWEWEDANNKNR